MKRTKITCQALWAVQLISCLAIAACQPNIKPVEAEREAHAVLQEDMPEVSLLVIQPSDFQQEILSNGVLAASGSVEVQWEVAAPIQRITVKNGDAVRKGQLLAEVDDRKLRFALRQAETRVQHARLEMQDFLIGQGYMLDSMGEVPEEVRCLASLRSGYGEAELACRQAELNLEEGRLRAPISGVVANLHAKAHNKAQGTFCTLLDNSSMEVLFPVMEAEVRQLRQGDEVSLSVLGGEGERLGRVVEINPTVESTGLVQVKAALLQPPADWLDGMKVDVRVRRARPSCLAVPKKAVVMRDNRQVVFTLRNGRAYWNYVTVGMENSSHYVITKGLMPGDSVIVDGNLNLGHLAAVKRKGDAL